MTRLGGSMSLYGEDILIDDQIDARIDYLEFLDDPALSTEDRELWEDEIAELAALQALKEATGGSTTGLISEGYWKEYAHNEADETFDLVASGADVYFAYGGYDRYADDLQSEFTSAQFGEDTYYYQG